MKSTCLFLVITFLIAACNNNTSTENANRDSAAPLPSNIDSVHLAPPSGDVTGGDTASYQRMQQKTTEAPE